MNQTDRSTVKARNRLLILFVLLCVLDIALVIMVQDLWAIGRILLTIGVMYFVIQGRRWAKWLLVSICSLLVVVLIAMVLALRASLSPVVLIGSVIMTILSAVVAIYLITNADLNRYFSDQRKAVSH